MKKIYFLVLNLLVSFSLMAAGLNDLRYDSAFVYDSEDQLISAVMYTNWEDTTLVENYVVEQGELVCTSYEYQTHNQKKNLTYYENYKWDGTQFQPDTYYKMEVDDNDHVIKAITMKGGNLQWISGSKQEYVYENNLNTQTVAFTWKNNTWVETSKTIYTYTKSGLQNGNSQYIFDAGTHVWKGSTKDTIFFNKNNQKDSMLRYSWDIQTGSWKPYYKYTYTYTDNKISQELTYLLSSGQLTQKIDYAYNNDTTFTTTSYNNSGTWNPSTYSKTIPCDYNGTSYDKLTEFYMYMSGSWVGMLRMTMEYCDQGIKEYTMSNWDNATHQFLLDTAMYNTFNQEGLITEAKYIGYEKGIMAVSTLVNYKYYEDIDEVDTYLCTDGQYYNLVNYGYYYLRKASALNNLPLQKILGTKLLINGQVYILKDGHLYNVQGYDNN